MSIYRVELTTTNGLKDAARDRINDKYIDVRNGFIYVTDRDLKYVMEHFEFISIEVVGLIFEKPCELLKGE